MSSRREFLYQLASHATLFVAGQPLMASVMNAAGKVESTCEVPIRALTHGPGFHWFGYYDKWELDASNRYVLSNVVNFEHRSPLPTDTIQVGYVDTQQQDKWTTIGQSSAWGWQQGCMLQWIPNEKNQSRIIWNDVENQQYISRIHDIATGKTTQMNKPVYTLNPRGGSGLSLDFSRLQWLRPGYGYVSLPVTNQDEKAPEDVGIWRVDFATGKSTLIISLAQLAAIPFQGESLADNWHWVNHLLVNPTGDRFIFLHRWKKPDPTTGQPTGKFYTRMMTANLDGTDLHIFETDNSVSHFFWHHENRINCWLKPMNKPAAFYDFQDQTQELIPIGADVMTQDGHVTYLPGYNGEWIVNDTYPQKETRHQILYLYHVPTGRKIILGKFHSPPDYTGEWRCDLHCRSSHDGKHLVIDSPHGLNGRQIWMLDIAELIAKNS
jgi:hypothetical protein